MPNLKTTVWITTQFEGIHFWSSAPAEVGFLRHPHRHIFHVKLEVTVHHDDRDVEFILLKRRVDDYIAERKDLFSGSKSCEMMARTLLLEFNAESVEVSEDGENGARVCKSQ